MLRAYCFLQYFSENYFTLYFNLNQCVQYKINFDYYSLLFKGCLNKQLNIHSMKKISINQKSFVFLTAFLFIIALANSQAKIASISQKIMTDIFHKNQFYVIYVYQKANPKIQNFFKIFCEQYQNCAILNNQVQQYENIRQFVGFNSKEYFLILDGSRQQKYVINVTNKFQYKDLYNFQASFTSRSIQPFYSSQLVPQQFYQPCRKLVGDNFDHFLSQPAPLKVVFLHTEIQKCQICGQMLRGFADIAQKIYRNDVIIFAYIDVFKNDHKKITQEIVPYFLVFRAGEDEPYGIEGEKFPQLETALVNIIAQHLNPSYFQQNQQPQISELNMKDLQKVQQNLSEQAENIVQNGNHYQL